jgi:hypothetical protein
MLDAIRLAESALRRGALPDWVWITWCDQVAVSGHTASRLARECDGAGEDAAVVLPTVVREAPYIHLARDEEGRIARILQAREGDTLPARGEGDMGLFALSRRAYFEWLPAFDTEDAARGSGTGERNFLPFLAWLRDRAEVVTFPASAAIESVGINTPAELRQVERHLLGSPKEDPGAGKRKLSIVIPAYDEERFIGTLLEQILAVDLAALGIEREILVIDDGSRDRTAEIASAVPGVRVERQTPNQGKGAAVRRGLALASGDFVIIQDADLEYDPNDYVPMLQRLLRGDVDAVYGSRYLGPGARGLRGFLAAKHPSQSWAAYLAGRSLSIACWLACRIRLTDTVTALKLFPREVVCSLPPETTGFELDHEITARLAAQGRRFAEVPISYSPRSREEGKKIGLRDFVRALRTFRRYRRG